ncbi:hypothetical protein TNCV_4454451 [Trichonephila clavipes]|nr:hypothetical protein TNCV_4454451 [Trichonephila clavipes]
MNMTGIIVDCRLLPDQHSSLSHFSNKIWTRVTYSADFHSLEHKLLISVPNETFHFRRDVRAHYTYAYWMNRNTLKKLEVARALESSLSSPALECSLLDVVAADSDKGTDG